MKRFLSLLMIVIVIFSLAAPQTAQAAIKISKTKATMEMGSTFTLKISGTTKKITWTSSDKKVATISSKGNVKAIIAGKTSIKAKVSGKYYYCDITVYDPDKDLTDLEKYLRDKGYITENSSDDVFYSIVGAINGFQYPNDKIEIYEFDVSTEFYNTFILNNSLIINDIPLKYTALNGKYILYCDDASNKKELIKAFNEFK